MLLRLCVVVALGWLLKSKPGLHDTRRSCRAVKYVRLLLVAVGWMIYGSAGLAQSNDVFSFVTTPSTPLTAYRVAAVGITPIWVVGSPPKRYGIEECSYWTDSAGQTILWPANRTRQAGDKQHRYTRVRLDHISVSVPLPPRQLGVLAGMLVAASGFILIRWFTKAHRQASITK